jgi:3-hydroxyisobutyrate dehydrogenase
MTSKAKIGYVGVGLMGLPMAKRLLSLGYAVRAYDIAPGQVSAARAAGAAAATSGADAVAGADLILINLPTPDAVEAAVFGENGVASALRPPQLVIDFSTNKVTQTKAFAQRLREKTGAGWIDAPVSGGPPASGSGTLTVMAGGEAADIERTRPFFADVAGRFTHMGPSGAGMATKMLNQLIVGSGHAVMAEAVVLAEAAGIDPARLPECLAGGRPAAEAVSADGQARLRAAGLRAAAAQGSRDGERICRRAESADADDGRGADAVPDARAPRPRRTRYGGAAQAL